MPDRNTIVVAMSGGVDSSVAAALLVEQGHAVIGVTMKTFCYSDSVANTKSCCGLDGIIDARRVAGTLGIPHYVFDMEESFTTAVIDDFVQEYVAGRTPNPCVRCNSNTKIPDLLLRSRRFGADAIATGHYARSQVGEGDAVTVRRSADRNKDQTYFLWGVPRDVIANLRFPLGELTKSEVRAYARRLGLTTADKPESQEICFVPHGTYADFLTTRLGVEHAALRPGRLVTREGVTVGEHNGYARYTIGQRRGLGGGFHEPLYVLGVRPETSEVVVGSASELYRADVVLRDLNWITDPPATGERIHLQLRHRADAAAATVTRIGDRDAAFRLERPQRAVTPGQSGVVYRGDHLVGGGRIED